MEYLRRFFDEKLFWRAIWRVAWSCVKWLPKSCSPIRVLVLRLFGAHIGRRCMVCPHVKILIPWNIFFGNNVSLGEGANLYNFSPIHVGDHSIVSQRSFLCTGTHDYSLKSHPLMSLPITIGPRAWLCAECFIHPGVTIGEGAVIGARAVVAKDMPPWTVCAGNPCRALKPRVMTDQGERAADDVLQGKPI